MNFDTLYAFQITARAENLTAAAGSLHISQPALSRTIHNLEKELGFTVFSHTGNRIELNENGREFLLTVNRIMERYNACISKIREENGIHSPLLIISFSSVGNNLPLLTYRFRGLHPETRYMLKSDPYTPENTTTHFFFLSSWHPLEGKQYTLLMKEPLYVAVSPKNPLASRKSVKLAELSKETFLFSAPGNDMHDIQMHYCREAGFTPPAENIIGKQNVLTMLTRLDMGITLLPANDATDLILIPVSDIDCSRYVYMIRNPHAPATKLAGDFSEYAIHFFKEMAERAGKK